MFERNRLKSRRHHARARPLVTPLARAAYYYRRRGRRRYYYHYRYYYCYCVLEPRDPIITNRCRRRRRHNHRITIIVFLAAASPHPSVLRQHPNDTYRLPALETGCLRTTVVVAPDAPSRSIPHDRTPLADRNAAGRCRGRFAIGF